MRMMDPSALERIRVLWTPGLLASRVSRAVVSAGCCVCLVCEGEQDEEEEEHRRVEYESIGRRAACDGLQL